MDVGGSLTMSSLPSPPILGNGLGDCSSQARKPGGKRSNPNASNPAKPRKPRKRYIRIVACSVCGDIANDHVHYGAIACYSCRAFFRRSVSNEAHYECSRNSKCPVTKETRKHCQSCRFKKCIDIGMKPSWVMTEDERKDNRAKILKKKMELRKGLRRSSDSRTSISSDCAKNPEHDDANLSPESEFMPDQTFKSEDDTEDESIASEISGQERKEIIPYGLQMGYEHWDPRGNETTLQSIPTLDEKTFLDDLVLKEAACRREIPIRHETLIKFMDSAKHGTIIPYDACVDGFSTCVQRISKFMSRLDFFSSLMWSDQQILLRCNTHMVVNLKSARMLKPTNSLQGQLCLTNGTQPNQAISASPNRLTYSQFFNSPWCCSADKEEEYKNLMDELFNLDMDDITSVLMMIMTMLAPPSEELIQSNQVSSRRSYFSQLLYKHLFSVKGDQLGRVSFQKCTQFLDKLREMAHILKQERLLL
ncbi:hypothetical protein TCAL_09547 [Tigriopus californicus]|uniref:Nuclear receptor domain-containing protein n=1 Tax=Tigriopus californicus TaxID=6832 RepID=A0A553P3Z7_TIGCA|nr:vitamin D3 receptor-like [Tigriopus californicus]TRY72416.1 hypothetical protein TCAL_09547 [Tigriopus californicus]|eukprot:TCALIF_09547-PA protein Name:"Similar to VDR Vitamin D3 receptor (Gallus gallus)" AED:0.00 eAED:0.00 QI:781/1/1/1/1/1/2/1349/476